MNKWTKKCAVVLLMAALILSGLSFRTAAAEEENLKTVRVAVDDSGIFFQTDKNGDLISGYGFEYIQNIAAYANWNVEYLPCCSFSDCLEMVKNGEADLFYDVSYTEERAEWLLYPEDPMGTEEYYLFCLAGNTELHREDLSSFDKKRAGVTAGTIEGEELAAWCEKQGIEMEIIEFDSDPEKAAALDAGLLDMEYEVNMLANGDYSALKKISASDFYLVANIERSDLIDDINIAYEKINDVNKYFIAHLMEHYFSTTVINRSLSLDELAWVMANSSLKVGYLDDYLPFSDMALDGTSSGIVTDLLPEMLKNVGLEDEFFIEYYACNSTDELTEALGNGEIDAVFPIINSVEFGLDNDLLITSDVISLSADLAYAGVYSEDTVKTIAVNKNNLLQDYYTRANYRDAEILYCNSVEDCLRAVNKGRAGSTILNGLRTSTFLSDEDFQELHAVRLAEPFSFAFAVSKGNSALLSIFNRAIVGMDESLGINYAFNYFDTEQDSFTSFLSAHRTLILSVIIFVLSVLLIAALVSVTMTAKAKKNLAEANSAKTSFLFNMSHDIRTPMNAILGFTNVAKKSLENPAQLEDYLNKIEQSGTLLLSLINSVLEMSRIEAGKAELNEKPCRAEELFEGIRSTVTALAEEKDIDLSFSISDMEDPLIYADTDRVNRVFINLISNAVKYTGTGGRILVTGCQTGKRDNTGIYRFTIEDNGIGMSEEFQKKLFDEFTRENNSTVSGVQGTGLGLSVVRAFVELMRGTIECRSVKGEGTCFTVTLPFRLRKDEAEASETGSELQAADGSDSSVEKTFSGEGLRVLLAEDNELNRELATIILEDAGMTVEEAEDGTIAVALLEEKGPDYYDAVLMDIQMPIMNGYEATKAIRTMYPDAAIPIIAVSANAFAEDREASLAAGMNEHVAKPIIIKELLAALEKYIKK